MSTDPLSFFAECDRVGRPSGKSRSISLGSSIPIGPLWRFETAKLVENEVELHQQSSGVLEFAEEKVGLDVQCSANPEFLIAEQCHQAITTAGA